MVVHPVFNVTQFGGEHAYGSFCHPFDGLFDDGNAGGVQFKNIVIVKTEDGEVLRNL